MKNAKRGVRLKSKGRDTDVVILPRGTDVHRFVQALGVAAYNSAKAPGLGALAAPEKATATLSVMDEVIERHGVSGFHRLIMEYANGREVRLFVTQVSPLTLEWNRHQYEVVRGGDAAKLFDDAVSAYNEGLKRPLKPII